MQSRRRALIYITLIPVVWGTTFAVVKESLAYSTPSLFGLLRFTLSALFFIVLSKSGRFGLKLLFQPVAAGFSPRGRGLKAAATSEATRRVWKNAIVLGASLGA